MTMLALATVPVAFKTASMFKDESSIREKEFSLSQAEAKASEIEVMVKNLLDKSLVLGTLFLQSKTNDEPGVNPPSKKAGEVQKQVKTTSSADASLNLMFRQEKDFVAFEIFEKKDTRFVTLGQLVNPGYLEKYKLDKTYLDLVKKKRPFPIKSVFSGNVAIINSSLPQGAPLLALGLPITKSKNGQVAAIVVAYARLDKILESFAGKTERTIYLVDQSGNAVAHPDETIALSAKKLRNIKIVEHAINSEVRTGYLTYFNTLKKVNTISAFAKTGKPINLIVIAEAPESLILEPAKKIQRNVLFIALLVLFGGIFTIALFSLTLTRPLEKLVHFTKQIAQGNFNVQASRQISSRDEVGVLALSFDSMTAGLQERDKVKNLFSKFHGSSVAENLIKGDVKVGGSRKAVVVFFSDVRNFTAYSEKRTPEEVVFMLNEYFSAMVRVIYRNHGIVDKFIGDAIMAVWGAPQSTGDDAFFALKSCLEMRQALADLNAARIARSEEPIRIGMGLHFGEAISGTIGSEDRMEYTVIGDTVNLTSRIESATKAFGTDLLVSAALAIKVREQFVLEKAGDVEVKGKSEPLTLYKVRGYMASDGKKVMVSTPYSDYEPEKAEKVKTL